MNLLFIYGTLKRGQCRAGLLTQQTLLATARTHPDYRIFQLDGYPGLIEVKGGSGLPIVGEIWAVKDACLIRLDIVEGVTEGAYKRRTIRINDDSIQQEKEAKFELNRIEAYFYLRSIDGRADCSPEF